MGSSRMACNLAGREYVDRTGDTSGVSCHCSVCLVKLAAKSEFWLSIVSSLLRIMGGFLLAVVTGTGLAALQQCHGESGNFWNRLL